MDSENYIITKPGRANSQRLGMKAWNLFLLKEKFSVPEFFVISTAASENYCRNKAIDPDIENQLRNKLEGFLKNGKVAIRSSGTAEDLTSASFAGMYKTFLGINNVEDGIRAIKGVWESVNSERVMTYCKEMKLKPGQMAVIVQRQLNAEISGVMITQSPYTVNEVLIECCCGFGDKLVSGLITPSRYRVKEEKIVQQNGESLLTLNQVVEIARMGRAIDNFFNAPQDIEWAIENGKIFILQARPLSVHTAIPKKKTTVWCNVNVRETIPDPVSPLMWSFFEEFLFPMIILDIFGFPISREKFKRYSPVENLSGRLYWNMNNVVAYGRVVGPLLNLLESNKNLDPQMAMAFKAIDKKNIPFLLSRLHSTVFSVISLIRLTNFIIKSFFFHRSFARLINDTNTNFEKKIESMTISKNLSQGVKNIEHWILLGNFGRKYFSGLFLSLFYIIILERILGLRLGIRGRVIARKCVVGLLDMTGLMVKGIDKLSELAGRKLQNISLESLKDLYQRDSEFRDAFDKFLRDFGHRGPGEFDIASKTYSEDPDIVFHMLIAPRNVLNLQSDRKKIIREILDSLNPFERKIVKSFLPRLETYYPLRENGKHYYFKQMAKIKVQLFTIADYLIEESFIKEKRDIFFINWNELKSITEGKIKNSEVSEIVERRKQEWNLFKNAPVPDIIYETGERISAGLNPEKVLHGEPLSFGKVKARARIIRELREGCQLKKGEILVTHHSDPGWTPLFSIASGVIIEVGGFVCHAAMVARELGVPAVVIKGATSIIEDGQEIELDADSGRVEIIT